MNVLRYGVIGNCKSAALVSEKGAIEWCCLPDFTSPSVFAKLLDSEKGGEFSLLVDEEYTIKQEYLQHTNILVTHFCFREHAFRLIDFMPRYKDEQGRYHCPPDIIRFIRHVSGSPRIRVIYRPKLIYAEVSTRTVIEGESIKSYSTNPKKYDSIYLYSNMDLEKIIQEEELTIEEDFYLLLSYNQKILELNIHKIYLEFERTKVYWLNWIDRTVRFTQYNEEITRSCLVLKLLSFQETGALLAALTTSIPESLGHARNWDYRFCWIRDASMIISTLIRLGHYNTAERFLKFIIKIIPYKNQKMQIMYGIRGEKRLTEMILSWLNGFENDKPVRIGNNAYRQKQNDIYGILLDVIYTYLTKFETFVENTEELWTIVRNLLRTTINDWKKPDTSIWEFRTQKRDFVFSKVLSWVALDRGIKIAELFGKRHYVSYWTKIRDRIKMDIMKRGWNEEKEAFTQYYGSDYMDAANLLMAPYGFIDYHHPKYVQTVLKTKEKLCRNGLMYRYRNRDDFGIPSSSFTMCTFWMIKSLYRIGMKKEAKEMFQKVLGYANHLGLFSEDIDFETKRLLGNFPQGYSHLALIDAAMTLSEFKIEEEDKIINLIEHARMDEALKQEDPFMRTT